MDWRTWLDRLTVSRPALSRSRIRSAYAVAVATDILQFLLGPLGWAFSDEILDIIALVVTTRLLGFHPLLLPTFVLELVPVADMLPTWTACVALVIAMKKKQPPAPGPDQEATTIDVKPTRVT
jgi:hypothetical protein